MNADTDTPRSWWGLFAAVAAVGMALRLAGIGAESVDLEEYACVGALHAPDAGRFLLEQRALYPYGAPGVPLLFYFWSGLFGDGIVAVRLFSALAGVLLLLLLPALAREIWPENPRTARIAGLVAALCAALSPVFLFQAQEARMYAFVALFAALSGMSLLRAVRTGQNRWWLVNLAANAALVWSHYFAVFLWPAQALWLLGARGVRWRARVCWALALALLLVPVAIWVSGIAQQPRELHDYYIKPDIGMAVRSLIAGDVVNWSSAGYVPSARAWSFAPETLRQIAVNRHAAGDYLIAGVILLALVWGAASLLRRNAPDRGRTTYLLLWALVPFTLLVAGSFVWKPIYASRYLTHASLALYLLLGGLVAALPRRMGRAVAVLLAALYAWQLSLALPPQTRTAWRQTGRLIEQTDGSRTVALVQGVFWKPIFDFNLPPGESTVAAVLEPEPMAEMAAFVVRATASLEPRTTPSCWVVLVDAIHGQGERFESAAAPLPIVLEKHHFPGERRLYVCRVSTAAGTTWAAVAAPSPALVELAQTLAGHAAAPEIPAFLDSVRTIPDTEGGGYVRLGLDLAQKGRVVLAAAVLDQALAHWPAHLVDLVRLERALSGGGDFGPLVDVALAHVKAAPERTPALRQVLQSLLERNETAGLRDACGRMIAAFPEYCEGYAYLGKQDYEEGRRAEALPRLERAVALRPEQPGFIYAALSDALIDAGRCPEALKMLEQGLRYEAGNTILIGKLADAHVDCGDPAQAEALTAAALAKSPEDNGVRRSLVGALVRRGELDRAAEETRQLIQRKPAEVEYHLLLWRIYALQHRDADAEQALRDMARAVPAMGEVIMPCIDAIYVRKDPVAAREALLRVNGNQPLSPDMEALLRDLFPADQPAAGGSSS